MANRRREEQAEMITSGLLTSKTDEWETPSNVFEKLDKEFRFTLDPCSTEENHKCAKYYTKQQDGLIQTWGGETVFCNPPYGKAIKDWIRKAWKEHTKPGTTVVMLLPARTDTEWFHRYIYNRAEIRFIKGRLRFGTAKNSAPFPSMIVIYRSVD